MTAFATGSAARRRDGSPRAAFALLAVGLLSACSAAPEVRGANGSAADARTLILVSFDGFRWDYPEIHGAPTLLALARDGVRAELVPSFPSKTYPNHYTLVTGLRPEHHGIVANTMWDPVWNARFSLADRSAVEDARWWEGEPIWATAEKAGIATANSFWPGSEAAIGGVRPTIWKRYDATVDDFARVDEALGWLGPARRAPLRARRDAVRPRLLALYFEPVDTAGHRFGPRSPETAAAVGRADALLARLRAGVEARGLGRTTDWVVVADHGMTETDPGRTIALDELLDPSAATIDDVNVVAQLRPLPGREGAILSALAAKLPALHAVRREEMPERLRFRDHRRIPPVVVWVDPGWMLYATSSARDSARDSFPAGMHGYDPDCRDMHAIFVAAGPSFRHGASLGEVDNVDVHRLLARLLGLVAPPDDGTDALADAALRSGIGLGFRENPTRPAVVH